MRFYENLSLEERRRMVLGAVAFSTAMEGKTHKPKKTSKADSDKVKIGKPQIIKLPRNLQKKVDKLGDLAKKRAENKAYPKPNNFY